MRNTTKKKIAPIVITAAVVAYMAPLVLAVLSALGPSGPGSLAVPLLLAYAVLGGGVIVGIIRALLQRLAEIDGGEEEEASQY